MERYFNPAVTTVWKHLFGIYLIKKKKKSLRRNSPIIFQTNYFCDNSADTLPWVAISP